MKVILANPLPPKLAKGLQLILDTRGAQISHAKDYFEDPAEIGNPSNLSKIAILHGASLLTCLVHPAGSKAIPLEQANWCQTKAPVFLMNGSLSQHTLEVKAAFVLAHWVRMCDWRQKYPNGVIYMAPEYAAWSHLK